MTGNILPDVLFKLSVSLHTPVKIRVFLEGSDFTRAEGGCQGAF